MSGFHFDGSITLGNILTILVLLWPVIRFSAIMRDFPPHRHIAGREGKDIILYPRGMMPGRTRGEDDSDEDNREAGI